MKRLLILFVLLLVPAALFAQADRDVLLIPDGTLYTIDSEANDGTAPAQVNHFLRLTVQRGTDTQSSIVPESLTEGLHYRPALAYDTESKTLFAFWLRMPNAMSSELLLASYANGKWQKAISIDSKPFHLRYNLRIGITRRVATLQKDGTYGDVPALLVHAVWWEVTGDGEEARYALMSVESGNVTSFELHDLAEFTSPGDTVFAVDANFNDQILKHPAILDASAPDSVDVLFGDLRTNAFNRVTIHPIADGRIHIPIGAHPGGPHFGAPASFSAGWSGRVSTITSGRDGTKLILYNATPNKVSYLLYADGAWSPVKSLAVGDKLTTDGAVAAISRMANAQ